MLDLGFTFGPGVNLSLRATSALQFGAGAYDGRTLGLQEGRLVNVREQRGEFGVSLAHLYTYRRNGEGALLDYRHPRWADPGHAEYPLGFKLLTDRRPLDFGVTCHLGLFGGNLAVRPDEIADFLTGLVGFDLLGDDAFEPSEEELYKQAHSLDARKRAEAMDALQRRGHDIFGYGVYTVPEVRPAFQRKALTLLDEAAAAKAKRRADAPEMMAPGEESEPAPEESSEPEAVDPQEGDEPTAVEGPPDSEEAPSSDQ